MKVACAATVACFAALSMRASAPLDLAAVSAIRRRVSVPERGATGSVSTVPTSAPPRKPTTTPSAP